MWRCVAWGACGDVMKRCVIEELDMMRRCGGAVCELLCLCG